MTARAAGIITLLGTVAVGLAACDGGTTTLEPETSLLTVAPEGDATGVALDAPVVVTFDHAMHDHAADYAVVHEGDVTGPSVPGTWTMEAGGTALRFTPEENWKPATRYTVHLGGGMMDADGGVVDMETHGAHMGGHWATDTMMSGGMHGGMGGGAHEHMGEGWGHANGSYGMVFTFTTSS